MRGDDMAVLLDGWPLGASSRRLASTPRAENGGFGRPDCRGGRSGRTRHLARDAIGVTMNILIDDSCFDLREHQIMRFDGATGVTVACLRGELWLTQDGDLRDLVLGPGDRFTLDHTGLTLVSALRASSLCVELPVATGVLRHSLATRARMAVTGVRAAVLPAAPFAIRPQ
jgi:hypothetical protein